jgi:hypothetical protein
VRYFLPLNCILYYNIRVREIEKGRMKMKTIERYAEEVNSLNERLKSKELTLKEYTQLVSVLRQVLVGELEKENNIKTY